MTLTKYRLGDLIEQVNTRNKDVDNRYTSNDVNGVTIEKEIINTKANVKSTNLEKFFVVSPKEFVLNPRTHGVKIGLGFNDSNKTFLISWNNIAFKIKDISRKIIDPYYLFIYFNRQEWDRHATFNSWGSSTLVFSFDILCDMKIDLPTLDIQKKYVAIYKAMLENQAAYEKGLEDLKLACDGSMDKLKENYKLTRLKKVLKIVDIRNKNLNIKDISGLNIEKRFIKSNSNVNENGLKNYKIVKPDELVFSGMQTGRDKCIRIALNTTNNNLIVSPAYNVFSINKNIINSKYLMLWFSRDEVDRHGWFISDSSIRSNLDLDRFYEIEIPLPPITIQNSIANIYKVYTDRKEINEKLKERLKNICPILIKGAVEEAKRKEA